MAFPLWFMVLALGIASLAAEESFDARHRPSERRKCELDLGLVIDQTGSMLFENLPVIREAVKRFVTNFIIGTRVHVSLASFANLTTVYNKFSDQAYHSEKALFDLVDRSLTNLSSPTRLDRAVVAANEEIFTQENGDRPGALSVMVILTDGKTNLQTEDFTDVVKSLKARGVLVYVIAFGPKLFVRPEYMENLKKVGGDQVYIVSENNSLVTVFDELAKEICPDRVCSNDIVLVADKTGSIGKDDFKLMKGFLLQISDSLIISPFASLEVVITFANEPDVLNTFADSKFHNNAAMHNLIDAIDDNLGNITRTDKALEAATDVFQGRLGPRPKVLVVLTDGKTNPQSKPYDQIIPGLKELKVHIVVVGIGPKAAQNKNQLKEISPNHVHLADDFDDLSNLHKIVMDEICGDGSKHATRASTDPEPEMA